MQRFCFSFVFTLVFLLTVVATQAQTQLSSFTGTWILDKNKTNTSKDFPIKLKNYGMVVSGTENSLNVKSMVEGNVQIEAAGRGSTTPVTESASRLGTPQVTGANNSSGLGNTRINYGGTMAIFFTVNDATYNLNGEEVKVETKQGLVRVKAKPDKSGKSLQFTTIRRMKTPNSGEMEITTREVWKLSEDGKSLKLQRIIETPNARDEIIMMLARLES